MSYGTLDRFGGNFRFSEWGTLQYAKTGKFCDSDRVSGCGHWWPDFGPRSTDYTNQHGLHPTDTVFRNTLGNGSELSRRRADGGSPEAPRLLAKQFRQPSPAKAALYSSTVIMPPSAGRQRKKEGDWAKPFPAVAAADAASTLSRNSSVPAFAAAPSDDARHSLASSAYSSSRGGRGSPLSLDSPGIAEVPASWFAQRTIASRPIDAAGHAGTGSPCRKLPTTDSLSPKGTIRNTPSTKLTVSRSSPCLGL